MFGAGFFLVLGFPLGVGHAVHRFAGVIQADIDLALVGSGLERGDEAVRQSRQLGLVDAFGSVDDAVAWAAKKAGAKAWHAAYIESDTNPFAQFLQQMETGEARQSSAQDLAGVMAARQQAVLARIEADVSRLIGGGGMRAYCLECAGEDRAVAPSGAVEKLWMMQMLARLLG